MIPPSSRKSNQGFAPGILLNRLVPVFIDHGKQEVCLDVLPTKGWTTIQHKPYLLHRIFHIAHFMILVATRCWTPTCFLMKRRCRRTVVDPPSYFLVELSGLDEAFVGLLGDRRCSPCNTPSSSSSKSGNNGCVRRCVAVYGLTSCVVVVWSEKTVGDRSMDMDDRCRRCCGCGDWFQKARSENRKDPSIVAAILPSGCGKSAGGAAPYKSRTSVSSAHSIMRRVELTLR
jgi:hypothetical protein